MKFTSPDGLVETLKDAAADDKDSDIADGRVAVSVADSGVNGVTAGFSKNVGKLKRK